MGLWPSTRIVKPMGVITRKYTRAIRTGVVIFDMTSAKAIQERKSGPSRVGTTIPAITRKTPVVPNAFTTGPPVRQYTRPARARNANPTVRPNCRPSEGVSRVETLFVN